MAQKNANQPAVLFVCLGNICRSPLAEGLCIHHLERRGLGGGLQGPVVVDSAGTISYHHGNRPDPRSLAVARDHGVRLPSRARRVKAGDDFDRFSLIVPMDRDNELDLIDLGAPRVNTRRLGTFLPAGHPLFDGDVPDPYTLADEAFKTVYDMLDDAMPALVDHLLASAAPGA